MQNTKGNSLRDDYINLIEYLKWNFIGQTISNRQLLNEYRQIRKKIENLFDICVSWTPITKTIWMKRYSITRTGKQWEVLVGTASLLFAHSLQSYRDQILEEENIDGIITLKNAFCDEYTIPAAVIVFGDKPAENIWLTSAASTEDIISIFSDIYSYHKNVYYTKKLDPHNFMPENYTGMKKEHNDAFDICETKMLRKIADIIPGKSVNRMERGETGIHYLGQRDIQQGVIVNPNTFVTESIAERYPKQLLQEGDILIAKKFEKSKVARVTSDNLPAIASNSLFIIRPFRVPDEYLYQFFTSKTSKAILEKQLSSIKRAATVVSISKAVLEDLNIPVFDEQTMIAFSRIEEMRAAEILPTIQRMNQFQRYRHRYNVLQGEIRLETKAYNEFIKAGWSQDELQIDEQLYPLDLKAGNWIPDIALLDGDKWVGAVEIITDFSSLSKEWALKIREIIKEARIPCLVLSTGFYYEVHFTQLSIVKKLEAAPSKDLLLSIMNGKECV